MTMTVVLYRNHYSTEMDSSRGYSWHKNRDDAKRAYSDAEKFPEGGFDQRAECAVPVSIHLSKGGLLDALNKYASHPDNG